MFKLIKTMCHLLNKQQSISNFLIFSHQLMALNLNSASALRGMAEWLARRTREQKVVGSNPGAAGKEIPIMKGGAGFKPGSDQVTDLAEDAEEAIPKEMKITDSNPTEQKVTR